MVVVNTKAESVNLRVTVNLGGSIDGWANGGYGRYLFYGGLNNNNLTFISTMQGSGTSQEKISIPYIQGMDIKLPSITMERVEATYDTITFDKVSNPGYVKEANGVPGFELPLFVGALVVCGIIIKYRKK